MCDGIDNDCNGQVDDSCATPTPVPTPTQSPTPIPGGGGGCDPFARQECYNIWTWSWDDAACTCFCDPGYGCFTPVLLDIQGNGFSLTSATWCLLRSQSRWHQGTARLDRLRLR
jgi:hypothetical protein